MHFSSSTHSQYNQGYLLVLVLVLGSVFIMIIGSFITYVISQNQVVNFRYEQQRATEIAEAGLNYYKWYLAHFPNDVTNGTGLPGPYVETYSDPEGGVIGEFSLSIASTTYCGAIASIEVTSTGRTDVNPDAVSIISARYTRPTVAEYSFITNDGVWYGAGGTILGPLHSNNGIRMESAHNSFIGSGQANWTCNSSYGCNPNQTVDGVYTTSGNATPGLFSFPVAPIDFAGMTLDLSDMRSKSQNNGGIYYGPSGGFGYNVTFNGDSTLRVERVTGTLDYRSQSSAEGTHWGERNIITNDTFLATHTISADCPLLFFEDKVWLQGDVNQKVTLAAANLSSGAQTNIVINGDIEYVPGSEAGLLVIAEDDLDLGVTVPNDMIMEGIFIAQNGRYGRNHYSTSWFTNAYDQFVLRNSLTRLGTVVTNNRAVTTWVNSGGNPVSGFRDGTSSFDRNQIDSPPPLTPETSDVYSFTDWRQEG